MPRPITFALVGFGNTGRAFVRLWMAKRREILASHGLELRMTGIATRSHGLAMDPAGIDPKKALRAVQSSRSLGSLHAGPAVIDTLDFIARRPADVVFEITPLDPLKGQPALDHIRTALENGMHVVTANKGPVAVAYRELRDLARRNRCGFRFEGVVMDGAPIFSLVEKTLPGTAVLGFYGILNSTCNFILTEMEKGRSFSSALKRAQAMGIAEADPSHDIDGWDAAAKTAALANVLMDANTQPSKVERKGIGSVRAEDLERARRKGMAFRLVARAYRRRRTVTARVAPELLDREDLMAHVHGTTNALAIRTDTMKELVIFEKDPGVDQTAYALLSDLLHLASEFPPTPDP